MKQPEFTFHHHTTLDAESLSQARFGEGTGRIWLTSVQCTGSERALMNCIANSSATNSCTHAQDAGVRCQQGITMHLCMYPESVFPCLGFLCNSYMFQMSNYNGLMKSST